MSYSRRTEAEGRRERLTNTSITTSGVRDVESTEVMSNETDTIVDQRSAGTGTTDSEMFITDAVNEDRDLDASTVTTPRMQRGSGDSEKGLGGVARFVERNPDNVASTLDWRGRVLHSQEATQATNTRQQLTAEERWRASFEIEVKRIREHYQKPLETETVRHEEIHEWAMEELEEEENDEMVTPLLNGGSFNRITSPRSAAMMMGADKALCPKISSHPISRLPDQPCVPCHLYRFAHALRVHDWPVHSGSLSFRRPLDSQPTWATSRVKRERSYLKVLTRSNVRRAREASARRKKNAVDIVTEYYDVEVEELVRNEIARA